MQEVTQKIYSIEEDGWPEDKDKAYEFYFKGARKWISGIVGVCEETDGKFFINHFGWDRPTHYREVYHPKKKRWKPKVGQEFFCFSSFGDISGDRCVNSKYEDAIRSILGVYKTREEAKAMRDKILAFVTEQIGEA